VFEQSYFSDSNFPDNMPHVWYAQWAHLHEGWFAPVLLGEWGGRNTGQDHVWQTAMAAYLRSHQIGSFYWVLNPESEDTGGLYISMADGGKPDFTKLEILAQLPATKVMEAGAPVFLPPLQEEERASPPLVTLVPSPGSPPLRLRVPSDTPMPEAKLSYAIGTSPPPLKPTSRVWDVSILTEEDRQQPEQLSTGSRSAPDHPFLLPIIGAAISLCVLICIAVYLALHRDTSLRLLVIPRLSSGVPMRTRHHRVQQHEYNDDELSGKGAPDT
jgi:hypothetical protein